MPLPDEDTFYSIDTTTLSSPGEEFCANTINSVCPGHLDELLQIVWELRRIRMLTLFTTHISLHLQ